MREVSWPDTIDETMMPPTSGSIRKPDSIGVAPCTICRNCGSSAIPPNIAMPISRLTIAPSEKMPVRNSRSGSSASSP